MFQTYDFNFNWGTSVDLCVCSGISLGNLSQRKSNYQMSTMFKSSITYLPVLRCLEAHQKRFSLLSRVEVQIVPESV